MTTDRPAPAPPARRQPSAKERWTPLITGAVSTVIVFGLAAWWIGSSEQWPRVRDQFFSLAAIRESFPRVFRGFLLNVRIWIVTLIAIMAFSLVVAVVRSLTGPIAAPFRLAAIAFIDLLRGVPSLLLILLFGFGIPALQLPGLPTSALFWGSIALIAGYSAYTAEVYRSGMEAVPNSQRAAARALGLTQAQTLRYAIIPQAVRNVSPALLNLAVALQKDVALLSVLGVREAVREAQIYTARTFNYSSLVAAAVLFLIASIPLARFTDWYAKRDQERRLQRAA